MNTHEYSSKLVLLRVPLGRCRRVRGFSMTRVSRSWEPCCWRTAMSRAPEHRLEGVEQREEGGRHHQHDPEDDEAVEHLALVEGAFVPEVDEHDAQPVEGVMEHGPDEADLHQVHDRVLVRVDDRVVG